MSANDFDLVPYPENLVWPADAGVIAALHPELVQAPFRDPTFFAHLGLEPSDEARYRPWAQPPGKSSGMIAVAVMASLHACLGRAWLTLLVPRGQQRLGHDDIHLALHGARGAPRPEGHGVEQLWILAASSGSSVALARALELVLSHVTGVATWLEQVGFAKQNASPASLLEACTLARSLAAVYLTAADYSVSHERPDLDLDGLLVVVDDAIVTAVTRFAKGSWLG